jgi:transposase
MSNDSIATIASMGIDIGKHSFHVVGLDQRGAIVLRQNVATRPNRKRGSPTYRRA